MGKAALVAIEERVLEFEREEKPRYGSMMDSFVHDRLQEYELKRIVEEHRLYGYMVGAESAEE